jgi:hypothetical protein
MEKENSSGQSRRTQAEEMQMKVHPNKEFSKMIRNGKYKVIPNRFILEGTQTPLRNDTGANRMSGVSSPGWLPSVGEFRGIPNKNNFFDQVAKRINQMEAVQLQSGMQKKKASPEHRKMEATQIVPKSEKTGKAGGSENLPEEETTLYQEKSEPLRLEINLEAEEQATAMETIPESEVSVFEHNIAEYLSFEQEADRNESNPPPFINFAVFNRMGLSIQNLTNLLESEEEFELNIIDCNSQDNSWDYIKSLTDRRIKSKTRFTHNLGPIYAVNYALSRRKPNQYFITIDSDTFIKTKQWISKFMEVFDAFPEVGLLGVMRDNPYPRFLPPIVPKVSGSVSYLELKNADINAVMDFIPGQLQCLRPSIIKEIGYWSEENGFGDAELSPRIVHYTGFNVGFITTIEIDMTQKIPCNECKGKEFCTLSRSVHDCFSLSKRLNKNESFVDKNTWKFQETFQQLQAGTRMAYCASIHEPESMKNHRYNRDWAFENFSHYFNNAN